MFNKVNKTILLLRFLTSLLGHKLNPTCPSPRLWPAPASCTSPRRRSGDTWSTPRFPHMLLHHKHTQAWLGHASCSASDTWRRCRTKTIKVQVFADDDVEQRVAGRRLHRDLLPVSVDEVDRHLVVWPETHKRFDWYRFNTNYSQEEVTAERPQPAN